MHAPGVVHNQVGRAFRPVVSLAASAGSRFVRCGSFRSAAEVSASAMRNVRRPSSFVGRFARCLFCVPWLPCAPRRAGPSGKVLATVAARQSASSLAHARHACMRVEERMLCDIRRVLIRTAPHRRPGTLVETSRAVERTPGELAAACPVPAERSVIIDVPSDSWNSAGSADPIQERRFSPAAERPISPQAHR